MKWNLRLAAANRGIWKASELQRMLAERGVVFSVGKMSGLWSGNPASFKGTDLDALCAVLGCRLADIMAAEPEAFSVPERDAARPAAIGDTDLPATVTPRRRDGRSLPPE
jgi:DNA-binding Xre family transcriptional regulator